MQSLSLSFKSTKLYMAKIVLLDIRYKCGFCYFFMMLPVTHSKNGRNDDGKN